MRFAALLVLAVAPACAGERAGWANRGRFEVLYESPSVQIRRGGQKIDPATGELVISWVGARTPDDEPWLFACELTVFDDRNGDDVPDVGEVVTLRESREKTHKVLFNEVRVPIARADHLRARVVANTKRERCVATWAAAPDPAAVRASSGTGRTATRAPSPTPSGSATPRE